MNDNENINNQSGNNSTTFNANKASFDEQKNATLAKGQSLKDRAVEKGKDALVNKATSTLAKTGPAGAAAAAGIKKMQEMKQKREEKVAASNEATADASAEAKTNTNNAKEKAKSDDPVKALLNKNKLLKLKIYGILAGIGALILAILIIVVGAKEFINNLVNGLGKFNESLWNWAETSKFENNYELCLDYVEAAPLYTSYEGLDTGMLYATVVNGVGDVTSFEDEPNVEGEDDVNSEGENFGETVMTIIGHSKASDFFRQKREFFDDKSLTNWYPIQNALVSKKTKIACAVKDDDEDSMYQYYLDSGYVTDNKLILAYIYDGLLSASAKDLARQKFDGIFPIFDVVAKTLHNFIEHMHTGTWGYEYVYRSVKTSLEQDLSKQETTYNIDELTGEITEAIMKNYIIDGSCYSLYNDDTVKQKDVKKLYKVVRENDYEKFYNYLKGYYVPIVYNEIWDSKTVTDEERLSLVQQVWDDIVTTRNEYYVDEGIDDELLYNFDDNDKLNVTRLANIYVSNISLSEASKAALSWKQSGEPWSGVHLGDQDRTDNTIGKIGCLVTTISKLMILSGTEIRTDTFDPGVVSKYMRFTPGGSLYWNSPSYIIAPDIAPNFKLARFVKANISASVDNISSEVSSLIASTGLVGDKYYYSIHFRYTGSNSSGGHYVALISSDENGYVVSDPAVWANSKNEDTYMLNDILDYTGLKRVTIDEIEIYEKLD